MIGRRSNLPNKPQDVVETPRGFDDYEMKLGDMLRGERATLGKSLLDVQRELRIRATYIAAIENCDPDAFETPGFVAGYVRSYARYLGLDPDQTFARFCRESDFQTSHGMDSAAAAVRKEPLVSPPLSGTRDPFRDPAVPFSPAQDGVLSGVQPGAIGSVTVLVALIAALGYGGWSVLQEVQRVQVTPVDQTPIVLSDLDPLDAANLSASGSGSDGQGQGRAIADAPPDEALAPAGAGVFTPPTAEGFDRLYRPQALDVPVLIARDAPISTLDPGAFGSFAERTPEVTPDAEAAARSLVDAMPEGLRDALADDVVHVVAIRPSWVRVSDGTGQVLFTGIMDAGDTWAVPPGAIDPSIEVGESSAVYYVAGGRNYGPTGPRGSVTEDFALDPLVLAAVLPQADPRNNGALAQVLADLGETVAPRPPQPQVVEAPAEQVTIVATREAWVRVRTASGSVLYETIMQPGEFYIVPATEEPPTIRAGNAGAVFFAAGGQTYGPYGQMGGVADNLALSVENITESLAAVDLNDNAPLARAVAKLNAVNADR